MKNMIFLFYLITGLSISQTVIGKTEGASLELEDNRYELIFKNTKGPYDSFYMTKGEVGKDGLANLSKYVKLLFEQQKGDFVLEFEEDSVLLKYQNGKVFMELWKKHLSSNRTRSFGYTLKEFQELFGNSDYISKRI